MAKDVYHNDPINWVVKREAVRFEAVRSRKPGGMNRDHRATKIHAWVKIANLPLEIKEKKMLREKLAKHVNHEDEIFVECEETRSQELNKDKAMEHLNKLVEQALKVAPPRLPSKPSRNAKEERIQEKKVVSRKKKSRRESHEPAGNP